jgi:DNA polymerase-3 subunit delta'
MRAMTDLSAWGLIGHEWAVRLLVGRLQTARLGHAYLFTGPRGIGKTTLALTFARALNCTGDVPPCGVCRACDLTARGIHPDVHTLSSEEPGGVIKIEAVRDLQRSVSLQPLEGRYRVAMIYGAEGFSPGAADALLKTLEEPPPSLKLLLMAEVAEGLPPTIVSRCQVIALRPVATAQIEAALIRWGMEAERATLLARLSGGRPGWAIRAATDESVLVRREASLDELDAALRANRAGRFAYAEQLARDKEHCTETLEVWETHWRDVMLLAEGSEAPIVNADRLEALEALAGRVGPDVARRALEAVREAADQLGHYANIRLALEVMLLSTPFL